MRGIFMFKGNMPIIPRFPLPPSSTDYMWIIQNKNGDSVQTPWIALSKGIRQTPIPVDMHPPFMNVLFYASRLDVFRQKEPLWLGVPFIWINIYDNSFHRPRHDLLLSLSNNSSLEIKESEHNLSIYWKDIQEKFERNQFLKVQTKEMFGRITSKICENLQ